MTTNLNAITRSLSTEFEVYEFNFSGVYFSGDYNPDGPCQVDNPGDPTEACPVDGQRVENIQFFLNPGVGTYAGTLRLMKQ